MTDNSYKRTTVAPTVASQAASFVVDQAPAPQVYVPGFFDRQLDRLIDLADRVMPDLAGLGLVVLLGVVGAIAYGVDFSADDVTYPMPMDAAGIEDALPVPAEPASSAVVAKPSLTGEVQDTRALARVR